MIFPTLKSLLGNDRRGNGVKNYLLDTHTILWWFTDSDELSPRARDAIADEGAEIFLSAASAWEVSTKTRLGKLRHLPMAVRNYPILAARNGFRELSVQANHGLLAGALKDQHRDPFDRMLAAQSILESMTVITRDRAIASLGAKTLW
ncbi:MAG: type II toxin-antitoxin system VapC family toxin [Leucobacter sp.]